MSPRLSRAESRTRTRAELVAAAIRLFARDGVSATSVEAISEDAGYSRGAYHSNFASREELMDAVMGRVVDELEPDLRAALDAQDTVEGLARYITRFLEFCEANPAQTRALVAVVAHRSMTVPGSYDDAVETSLTDLVALFERGQGEGSMRRFDPVVMAGLLRRALDGEALRVAGGVPAATAAHELVEIFVRATRADAEER